MRALGEEEILSCEISYSNCGPACVGEGISELFIIHILQFFI